MKVVINTRFGGFGLSKEALLLLAKKPCAHTKLMDPKGYYGAEWKEKFANPHPWSPPHYEGKVVQAEHRDGDERTCRDLVELVDALGDEANGSLAKLAIVEIPDGVEYTIEEYDGLEHVAEKHRTWR